MLIIGRGNFRMGRDASKCPTMAPHGAQYIPFKFLLLPLLFLLHFVAIAQANELLDFNELVPRL